MWSETTLAQLDTAAKGLRDVHVEPRSPADLWLRGSGTLDGPTDEWAFESAAPTGGSSTKCRDEAEDRDRISYPLRVRFEVALADQPECELGRLTQLGRLGRSRARTITFGLLIASPSSLTDTRSPTHFGCASAPLQDLEIPRFRRPLQLEHRHRSARLP